jgi:hypothetical protein
MAAQTGPGVRLTGVWHLPGPHSRRDRRRRQIRPAVEALEGKLLRASTSPANPASVALKLDGTPNPGPAGVAYQQVLAIQVATLHSLGDSYREVQATAAQFASRAVVAIDQLKAVLRQSQSRQEAHAIVAAIRRDQDLLNLGGANAVRVEQGLDVARGLADQQADKDKTYIIDRLFTNLPQAAQQDQSTGTAISRSGQRSVNALVRALNKLGDQLTSTVPVGTPATDQSG